MMCTSTPDRDVGRRRGEEDEETFTGSVSKKMPPKKTAVSHRWNHYTFISVLAMSVVAERYHGTAMASLILHGDRNVASEVLSWRLHMRPVLYAPGNGVREEPRRDRLLIDVIYRVVQRIKERDEEGEATAPEVFLINLSLADAGLPFGGPISPWARLLDHLAERYGILFLVSAGNVKAPLRVDGFAGWIEFEDADPADRERAVLMALSN